jgi:plasmid stabilization system protein ParE
MIYLVSPQAETELDAIWYYIGSESRSLTVADRLIDSIRSGFLLLTRHPHLGRTRDTTSGPAREVLSQASTSLCIVWTAKCCTSCTLCAGAAMFTPSSATQTNNPESSSLSYDRSLHPSRHGPHLVR